MLILVFPRPFEKAKFLWALDSKGNLTELHFEAMLDISGLSFCLYKEDGVDDYFVFGLLLANETDFMFTGRMVAFWKEWNEAKVKDTRFSNFVGEPSFLLVGTCGSLHDKIDGKVVDVGDVFLVGRASKCDRGRIEGAMDQNKEKILRVILNENTIPTIQAEHKAVTERILGNWLTQKELTSH